MSTTFYLVAAVVVAAAWLTWAGLKPSPKLDIPHVQFEGDNSMARYISETKSLLDQGQAQVIEASVDVTQRIYREGSNMSAST